MSDSVTPWTAARQAALNIHVQVFACIYVFNNHAYIPMSEIAGFYS